MVIGNTVSNNAFDKRKNIVLQVAEKGTKRLMEKTKVGTSNQGPVGVKGKL